MIFPFAGGEKLMRVKCIRSNTARLRGGQSRPI